jgi:Na+:H+ antiporter, NhaA family
MTAAKAGPNTDIMGSLVLLGATILALIFANSALSGAYKALLDTPVIIQIGGYGFADPLKVWIKNALMAVFFLYVGLEIKAEFTEGSLADRKRATLPFAAAVGGMAVPALVYLALTRSDADLIKGWAIPSATDIAFAVGVIGLLGRRVPAQLKAFLLAVAVIDDLGAILIIALFYTGGVNLFALMVALVLIIALALLNARNVAVLWPYMVIGLLLWIATSVSGINPTLAGVVVALFIPLNAGGGSPLHRLEHALKGAVVFAIMPIFAFANAGVSMAGLGLRDLTEPLTLGIAAGLAVGKPIGITLAVWLAVRSGLAALPQGANWRQIVGVGAIAGIGFTMSLFIGALAFGEGARMDQVRLGVLTGSLAATLLGVLLLAGGRRAQPD